MIARTLALYNNPTFSRNEKIALLRSLLTHPLGIKSVWTWMQENWESLSGQPGAINSFGFITNCLSGLTTREQLEEAEEFFKNKDTSVCYIIFFFLLNILTLLG